MRQNIAVFVFIYCEEQKYDFENNDMNSSSLNTELGLDLCLGHTTGHLLENVRCKISSFETLTAVKEAEFCILYI